MRKVELILIVTKTETKMNAADVKIYLHHERNYPYS